MAILTKNWILNIFKKLTKRNSWQDIEYFDDVWKIRIETMAQFIEPEMTVLDLGCGKMWLKDYLNLTNTYIPVDYIKRDHSTLVCNFNNYEFPDKKVDISFVSGCLEYVNDYNWFIKNICSHSNKCIVSYCILDKFPNIYDRKNASWVNNLSQEDLIKVFFKYGFKLTSNIVSSTQNYIYYFEMIRK